MQSFSTEPARRTATSFADTVLSWQGRAGMWPSETVRVDAASLNGRPVSFVVTGPWNAWQPPAQGGHVFIQDIVNQRVSKLDSVAPFRCCDKMRLFRKLSNRE